MGGKKSGRCGGWAGDEQDTINVLEVAVLKGVASLKSGGFGALTRTALIKTDSLA